MTSELTIGAAYSATGAAWDAGPALVYDRLAEHLVAAAPGPVAGARVLDLGAGTGAASRAAGRAGAGQTVAVDSALGMLLVQRNARPPAVVGDAVHLPLASGSFDGVLAAFSLNHLPDPAAGLAEVGRVLRPGGWLAASAYAADDSHPAKEAVEGAARARGWEPEPWYTTIREQAIPKLATVSLAETAALAGGLKDVAARSVQVRLADLAPKDLVAWRLGMAQLAPFIATLSVVEREALIGQALARLGPDPPPLVRSTIILTARAG